MPFCPMCLSEFRVGFEKCNSCDVDLVDQLKEEMELTEENIKRAVEGQELIPIRRNTLDVIKETRDLLSSHRIASVIVEDQQPPMHPGAPALMILLVPKDSVEATGKVLGENFSEMLQEEGITKNSDSTAVQYNSCPACGSKVSENTEECPECGLFVGKS